MREKRERRRKRGNKGGKKGREGRLDALGGGGRSKGGSHEYVYMVPV